MKTEQAAQTNSFLPFLFTQKKNNFSFLFREIKEIPFV